MAALAEQINSIGRQLFLRSQVEEDLLGYFYLKLKEERMLDWLYYQKVPSLSEFLAFHRRTDMVYLCGFTSKILDNQPVGEPELSGMGWVDCIQRLPGLAKGQVSMAFLRRFQQDETALELAKMMIDFAFDTVGLDTVLGTTPVRNRAACIFTERVGFQKIGVAQDYVSFWGEKSAALLSVMTKDRWRGGY